MSYVDGRRKEILAKLDRLIVGGTASLERAKANRNRILRVNTDHAEEIMAILTEARNKIERDGQP